MESRAHEYWFIFVTGLAGAMLGGVCDSYTSAISPEYFTVAKGLVRDFDLRDAVLIGIRAGFGGGALVGLTLVIANEPRWRGPGIGWRSLAKQVIWPLLIAPGFGVVAGRLGAAEMAIPAGLREIAAIGVSDPPAFRMVWCTHLGIYVGAVLSTFALVAGLRSMSPRPTLLPTASGRR